MVWRIGVDIDGTFTDVTLVEETSGRIGVAKVPTTPSVLSEGVLHAPVSAMSHYDVIPDQVDRMRWSMSASDPKRTLLGTRQQYV
jgi:N-methylhydantoinase A